MYPHDGIISWYEGEAGSNGPRHYCKVMCAEGSDRLLKFGLNLLPPIFCCHDGDHMIIIIPEVTCSVGS